MKFRYQGRTKEGELQVGFVEAAGRDVATRILANHDIFVLTIEQIDKPNIFDKASEFFGRVRTKDVTIFSRQFATLLEAHLPLNVALRTLLQQTQHPMLKNAIQQVSEDVSAGLSLSQALERQNNIFPPFYISMVRSAEVVGNLDEVSVFLADYMEKELALVSKARSAMIYPIIVISLFVIVSAIMITYVFPQIGPVFEQSGVQLPVFSRAMISVGNFLSARWPIVLTVLIIIGAIGVDYFQTPEGKALRDEMVVRLPLVRKTFLPITLTRVANTIAMLLKGGVPITQAIQISSQTIGNTLYAEALQDVAEKVRQGKPLSEAIGDYPEFFPPLVGQMIVVGEASGQIDQMFFRLSAFYSREADTVVGNMVDLIQPIMMVGIGLMVGVMFGSILLPLYQLSANIR